jgi:hypothetical protein
MMDKKMMRELGSPGRPIDSRTAPAAVANSLQIFTVVVNRDDTVQVVAANVIKETPLYYMLEDRSKFDYQDRRRDAFGFSSRKEKAFCHTSPRAALEHYMKKRQQDKQNALAVAGQATKQIASANELLMKAEGR